MPLSHARDIGVQSYCFRHFTDNRKVCDLTKQIGVNKIELCAVHADFDNPDAFKKIADLYHSAAIQIASIGVQTFTGDEKREKKWFQCAQTAGAKLISAHFTVDTFTKALPIAAKLCEEFQIRIGIHNHGGYSFCGSADVLQYLLTQSPPSIGLTLDTAWCMQLGPHEGNPIQWAKEKFKNRIHGVHYKDFLFAPNSQWTDVVIGTGNLNLPALVQALEETHFNGMAVIEYEADKENPVLALTECVKKMRAL